MDTEQEDVWYNWLGSSYQSIRFLRGSSKSPDPSPPGRKLISKVEEHINKLTQSLSNTQLALEKASTAEQELRREHAGCSNALKKQRDENGRLEREIKRLYEEVEGCYSKHAAQILDNDRLDDLVHDLVEQVNRAEREAEANQRIMDNERLLHLQERETLRVVQVEHENCLVSLRAAQDTLAEYEKDVAQRDIYVQNLKRHKSKISKKLGYFTSSLRKASTELADTKTRLSEVSEQLKQAEAVIQTHFTMLSSLETYKSQLAAELGNLRTNYETKTAQLATMRETLEARNVDIEELRKTIAARDAQLRDTELAAATARQELSETVVELSMFRHTAIAAEKDLNEMRDYHTKLEEERTREIAEKDHERHELKLALNDAHQENGTLKINLAAAEAEAKIKDERLFQEIAAHSRTSEAAAAQELRLQSSIENLKDNLQRTNTDLRKTRETLFALNEKCQSLAKAQSSLASYRARTKILLDTKQDPTKQSNLRDSAVGLPGIQELPNIHEDLDEEQFHQELDEEQHSQKGRASLHSLHSTHSRRGYFDEERTTPSEYGYGQEESEHEHPANVISALILKPKAQEQATPLPRHEVPSAAVSLAPLQTSPNLPPPSASPSRLSTANSVAAATCSSNTAPLDRQASVDSENPCALNIANSYPLNPLLRQRSPVVESPPTESVFWSLLPSSPSPSQSLSPKRVRFAIDEGYHTDDTTTPDTTTPDTASEAQIWDIISDLDRARKDFKAVRRQTRRRNLKATATAATAAALIVV
ncbi:hypothetical protein BDV97DRAFT_165947 [Delphinella strobiligena]|nr:hypothetical protein BDV97DRAFT_165947 [Delphinella strobiligena]